MPGGQNEGQPAHDHGRNDCAWHRSERSHRPLATGNPGQGSGPLPAFDDDVWELYDTTTDWTQAHDLAGQHPEKLAELQRLWLIEAVKYQVVPMDDRFVERGCPDGRTADADPGQAAALENSVVTLKNTSFSLTAQLTVPEDGADGMIVAQGGVTGG